LQLLPSSLLGSGCVVRHDKGSVMKIDVRDILNSKYRLSLPKKTVTMINRQGNNDLH
jgi:hypothetical protein